MAPRRSWEKANSPYWSAHVETWYRGTLEADEYCRRRNLSTAIFMRWARHLVNPEDLRKQTERRRNLHLEPLGPEGKRLRPKRRQGARRLRYGARSESGPVALQAFWSMHVEAMNWSGMGHGEYAAALGLSPYALRIWRDRLEESGDATDWRSLLHPSARAQLSSAANSVRRKYRLTPPAADGRSNRRRAKSLQCSSNRRNLGRSHGYISFAAIASYAHTIDAR